MRPILGALLIFGSILPSYALETLPANSAVKAVPSMPAPAVVSAEAMPAASAAPPPLAGCVAPLRELVTFHENEIAFLNQLIDRWESKVEAANKRREGLKQDVQTTLKKADDLLKQNTKVARHEAARLKKQAARIEKDIASIDRELKDQSKELAGEVREVSKETQEAFKDVTQQTILDIQKAQ
jgi:hypothetical protein